MSKTPSGDHERSRLNAVLLESSAPSSGHTSGKKDNRMQSPSPPRSADTKCKGAEIEKRIDEALEESFPASDPPACFNID